VDRMSSFNNLQIDHLSKQQVVGCERPSGALFRESRC
jgi:hypothetical protein